MSRKKQLFFLCLSAFLSGCATTSSLTKASNLGKVHHIEPGEFESIKSLNHDRITIIEVGAQWCKPCREAKPKLEQLAATKRGHYQIAIVDVGNDLEFLEQQKIYELPSWFVYFPDRREPIRTDGPMLEKIEQLALTYPNPDEGLLSELASRVKKPDPDRVGKPIPRVIPPQLQKPRSQAPASS